MSEPTLYGRPYAEDLYFSVIGCYEADGYDDTRSPFIIEEWSTRPPAYFLPRARDLIDRIIEDMDELDEAGLAEWADAGHSPDVQAAFEAALDLFATKITRRMADEKLRDLRITFDRAGQPLLDGEALYPPVTS